MRRLGALLGAAIFILPLISATQAKVMFVDDGRVLRSQSGAAWWEAALRSEHRNIRIWRGIMDDFGINYDVLSSAGNGDSTLKTLYLSTGVVPQGPVPGAATKTYQAAIHPAISNEIAASERSRTDSLTLSKYNSNQGGPLIYHLFGISDLSLLNGTILAGSSLANPANSTRDSTASLGIAAGMAGNIPAIPGAVGRQFLWVPAWGFGVPLDVAAAGNTVRNILKAYPFPRVNFTNFLGCNQCDSVGTWAPAADTSFIWEYGYPLTGKKAIYCNYDGAGDLSAMDSLTSANSPATGGLSAESDPGLIACSLVRLDSLLRADGYSGMFDWNRLPLRRGITVEALCSRGATGRGAYGSYGCIAPADTSALYATMDSLGLAGIPVAWGVSDSRDSMRVYVRDLIYAAKYPTNTFYPISVFGAKDTTTLGTNGNDSRYHVVDAFGRWRNRAVLRNGVADSCWSATQNDSCLTCNLLWQRAGLDSFLNVVGARGRLAKIEVAWDDDWSPKSMLGVNGNPTTGATVDSVMYAVSLTGCQAIRSDMEDPSATGLQMSTIWTTDPASATAFATKNPGATPSTNPLGYGIQQQQRYRVSINGAQVTILGHNGFYRGGGTIQGRGSNGNFPSFMASMLYKVETGYFLDSDGNYAGERNGDSNHINDNGVWGASAALLDTAYSQGAIRLADKYYGPRRAYIARFGLAEMAGVNDPGRDPVARNGWWVCKSLNNLFWTMNTLAGRTVMCFVQPGLVTLP